MRLLLDSHVIIAVSRGQLDRTYPAIAPALRAPGHEVIASVASIWELTIKSRLGKLEISVPPEELAGLLISLGITILPIEHPHATASIQPDPSTKDPFDRLLLAQCAVEGMRLVTVDRSLVEHPLAWRGS